MIGTKVQKFLVYNNSNKKQSNPNAKTVGSFIIYLQLNVMSIKTITLKDCPMV